MLTQAMTMAGKKATESINEWVLTVNTEATTKGAVAATIPILLPTDNSVSAYVDWGDGQAGSYVYSDGSSSGLTHTYDTAGVYSITVSCAHWKSVALLTNSSAAGKIVTGFSQLPAFNNTSFTNAFRDYTKLVSIPDNAFSNFEAATAFNYLFSGCTSLTTIGDNIFSGCTAATTFRNCFYNCTSLTTIGDNIFSGCTAATNFSYCFSGCTSLTTIVDNIFSGCTAATNFSYCFSGCTSLTSVPDGMFPARDTFFDHCFYNDAAMTVLPTLWISHPSASHSRCFYGCTNASNYADARAAGWA